MNIRDQLLFEHSKVNSFKIADYIGKNQSRFDTLFSLFINNEVIVAQRAAYTVGHCFDNHPSLIKPHLKSLVENLLIPKQHDAIIRASVRVLQEIDLPESLQGIALEHCYTLLRNPKSAIAIRAFSMSAIYKITNSYPELKNELLLTLEDLLDHEASGLRHRTHKIYNQLKKEIAS